MDILTATDIFEDLAIGQRSGFLRKDLRRKTDGFLKELFESTTQRQLEAAQATQQDTQALVAALETLVGATDPLVTGHDLVAQLSSLDRRTEAQLTTVTHAFELLREFSQLDLPEGMLPESASAGLGLLGSAEGDTGQFAHTLLNLGVRARTTADRDLLRSLTETRLWALNSLVLANIASAAPALTAVSPDVADVFRDETEGRARSLRDAAREAASRIVLARPDPVFAASLWATVDRCETWIRTDGIAGLKPIMAAATAAVESGHSVAERLSRDGALAYDGIRQALAYDSGIRAALRAYADNDATALTAFAATSKLQLGGATLDLPRSSLSQAANAEEGALVEIAGIVREAQIIVGGPVPRSVLLLGAEGGTQIRVLVPFTAVDSFGITTGVWIQVRGQAFPNGKDDLPGPVVQVGRIRRAEAAAASFQDALIHGGRGEFELRPGGLDLVAGRLAGSQVTVNEIGLRRSVGE